MTKQLKITKSDGSVYLIPDVKENRNFYVPKSKYANNDPEKVTIEYINDEPKKVTTNNPPTGNPPKKVAPKKRTVTKKVTTSTPDIKTNSGDGASNE